MRKMKLREYQVDAIGALEDYLYTKKGDPLIVAPTGSGKSVMIAATIETLLKDFPDLNFVVVQHRKELIEQNTAKIRALLPPNVYTGIYSAGLKSKEVRQVTIAGIQSIYNKANRLPKINVLIVDEAHLIPDKGEGMYRKFITALKKKNPNLRVVGFTATPFRMNSGALIDSDMFTDHAYEIGVSRLVGEGFLSPLISKKSISSPNTDDLKIRGGEFIQKDSEDIFGDIALTQKAVSEIERYTSDRKKVLIFCSGVTHAEIFSETLRKRGHLSDVVTGETLFRDKILEDFKNEKIKYLCNVDVLTTGFDDPGIDCLVLLRPTNSAGLYVQMLGRGMRISPGKKDCLVLDYGGNVERHGALEEIKVQKRTFMEDGEKKTESVIKKVPLVLCPSCFHFNPSQSKRCKLCGEVLPLNLRHKEKASEKDIMKSEPEIKELCEVQYHIHKKAGKPDSLRVDYYYSMSEKISDYLCFDHGGYAAQMAKKKWKKLSKKKEAPKNLFEATFLIGELRIPDRLQVIKDGKYWKILGYAYGDSSDINVVDRTNPLAPDSEPVETLHVPKDIFA